MNKNIENHNGITLIALVITIIVMLILVMVTIRISQNGNLFKHAANAVKGTKRAATEENALSDGNVGDKSIAEIVTEQTATDSTSSNSEWTTLQNGKISNGKNEVVLGDYIEYSCFNSNIDSQDLSYTSTAANTGHTSNQTFSVSSTSNTIAWRVLGVENGKLLIVAEQPQNPDGESSYLLKGAAGYNNVERELESICRIYGHGEHATGARSITAQDINNITGYDPTNDSDGHPFGYGQVYQYKNGNVTFEVTGENQITITYGGRTLVRNDVTTKMYNVGSSTTTTNLVLTESSYYEYLYSKMYNDASALEVVLLFGDVLSNYGQNALQYWLPSASVYAKQSKTDWKIQKVHKGISGANVWRIHVGEYNTDGGSCGVRPVVLINANVQLEQKSINNGITTWQFTE